MPDIRIPSSMVVFGDDRANRWSSLPIGYGPDAILSAILRAAGPP